MDEKWIRRLKIKRISRYAMIFCLAFLVIFAGFTVYGSKVGNFVVNLKDDEVKISASIEEGKETTRFVIPGIEHQDAATFSDFKDKKFEGIGIKSDTVRRRYIAFSFYLFNKSEKTIDYDIIVDVIDSSGDILSVLRILVLRSEPDAVPDLNEAEIFAKPEESEEATAALYSKTGYNTTDFKEGTEIVHSRVSDFEKGGKVKLTVIMWMEGWDEQCNDELIGDLLKMNMRIEAH